MSDTQTLSNGQKTEAKAKTKRQRRQPPPLPTVASASDMANVSYEGKVDTTPCSWEALPLGSAFSLSPDGSYLKVKTSRTQFRDCRNGQAMTVGSGRCYRVFF